MQTRLQPQRLRALLDRFPTATVLVVGDFFLDKYLDLDPRLSEPSLETGLDAYQVVGVRTYPGAAGTVVNNLRALEVNVRVLGAKRRHEQDHVGLGRVERAVGLVSELCTPAGAS